MAKNTPRASRLLDHSPNCGPMPDPDLRDFCPRSRIPLQPLWRLRSLPRFVSTRHLPHPGRCSTRTAPRSTDPQRPRPHERVGGRGLPELERSPSRPRCASSSGQPCQVCAPTLEPARSCSMSSADGGAPFALRKAVQVPVAFPQWCRPARLQPASLQVRGSAASEDCRLRTALSCNCRVAWIVAAHETGSGTQRPLADPDVPASSSGVALARRPQRAPRRSRHLKRP
jgi:hypothetical protein